MAIDVVMPQMGESVAEGTIIKWIAKVGDTVEKDDPLFEISTDKVDAEVPSPSAGVLSSIVIPEGETVEVGVKVAEIGGEVGAAAPAPAEQPATPTTPTPAPVEAAATQPATPAPAPAAGGTPVLMPQMGESVAEGTIIKWMVHEGDSVEKDDPLFEISTDKVDAEVPSPDSGVITRILVPEGETVEVGVAVAEIAAEGAAVAAPAPAPAATTPAPATTPPAPAPTPITAAPAATAVATASAEPRTDRSQVRSSPVARRIAREQGFDVSVVPGTGRGGRVSKKDVLAFVEGGGAATAAATAPTAAPMPAPALTPAPTPAPTIDVPPGQSDPGGMGIGLQPVIEFPEGVDTVAQPMNNMRRIIAEHMIASRRTSAHVQSVSEVDFSHIMKIRKKWKADFGARHGANLSVTTMVLHAIVPALRNWPIVNASLGDGTVEYHKHVHLGVAVALPDGLIVPVIRNVEQKGLGEIARNLADLGARARGKKLLPDEVSGSTFTVTNPGVFGTDFGLPIINQPNVAILGMGGIKKRVVVVEDEYGDAMAIRPTSLFCLSYDHRIIDGAVSSQFLEEVRRRIETFPEEVLAG